MDVVIAGGHGQIGLRLARLLTGGGDHVRGLIRNPDHARDVHETGAEAVLCDLEGPLDPAPALAGADAVVFAAGAGAGSGAERKRTMDYGGAVKLIRAAEEAGVRRYVMVSAMGAADPPDDGGVFGAYLRAKAAADRELAASPLDWTIVRPGRLTSDPGTGRITAGASVERGEIARDDVAAVLAAVLRTPSAIGVTFELVGGEAPIEEAVAALAR